MLVDRQLQLLTRDREAARQRDRQAGRQTDRQTHRHTETEAERRRERETREVVTLATARFHHPAA